MPLKLRRILFLLCTTVFIVGAVLWCSLQVKMTRRPSAFKQNILLHGNYSANTLPRHPATRASEGFSRRSRLPYNLQTGPPLPKDSATSVNFLNCFPEGTVPGLVTKVCLCRKGWNGAECSVPDAVWSSTVFQNWYSRGLIKRRSRPRLIINGFVFNHELDLLEIRVKELGDAVDYYVVCESNYTFFGTAKPLHLQSKLNAGFLREHAHKILPLTVGVFNYGDGSPWAPENYFRMSIWRRGQRELKHLLRDDDLFMIADADEIPRRDVLLFLKHHDGYGEPVSVSLRWFLYGFFWENRKPVVVGGACTVAFLRNVYENDPLRLRRTDKYAPSKLPNTGTLQQRWTIKGTAPLYAGWHCSWCFDIHGIQVKLAAAQRDDGIRWGDFADKTDAAYIDSLRKSGRYFDNSPPVASCDPYEAAPAYVRNNVDRFRYLMTA